MKKFQVTIHFEKDDEFMSHIPAHREWVNTLIEEGIIDQYVVSMETQQVWITVTAEGKSKIKDYLSKTPLAKYWTCTINELFLVDGRHYRLPSLQLN
jgi:hypothetical protein